MGVQLQYFDPANQDGPTAEWGSETITIRDIRFNLEIPDSQFVIELPANAQVYDEVTGQGRLPAGTPLPAWDKPPPPQRSWLWLWIVSGSLLVLLALIVAVFTFRRRRRYRIGGGTP